MSDLEAQSDVQAEDTRLARVILERDRYLEAAKEVQGRCTSLLCENRSLKTRLRELEDQKDGAYEERDRCVALVARMARALGLRAGIGAHDPSDASWDREWRTIVYVDLPAGQVSWHVRERELPLFSFLPRYDGAWDGHGANEKYRRVAEPMLDRALEADGILLPGWFCKSRDCGVFNGAAKLVQAECRACGRPSSAPDSTSARVASEIEVDVERFAEEDLE